MYDLRRFFAAQYLACRSLVCWCGLVAFSLNVRAAVAVDPAFDRFKAVITGNTVAVTFGSTGTPLAAPKSSAMGYVANGLTPSSGELSRFAGYSTKYGELAFKASQTITLRKLAQGVGAVAGGPLGVALLASPFLLDWLSDAGVTLDPSTGVPRSVDPGPIVCSMSAGGGVPRPGYIWHPSTGNQVGQWCGESLPGMPNFISSQGTIVSVGPSTLGNPLTSSEVESKLNSTPRTTSEIEKILSETIQYPEIQPDPVDYVRIDPVTPGGDIKSPSKTDTSTTTNPDGSKVEQTKTCWVKGTVQLGASLKLTEVCNTDTVSKSPSGTVTGTTTATTDSETADAATPKPKEPGFCETLVGKLVCADLDTPKAEPIDKTTKTLTYAPENHFGGGACPADLVMTTHNGQSLKVWDWATSCDKIKQFFRPLFLTLCAFTALMILAPAVKEA